MTILLTGNTDFKYNRVRVLVAGLEKTEGVKLLFYRFSSHFSFDRTAFDALQEEADFIYVPPFRHRDVSLIKKFSKKPVVFDPLISKYLTKDDFGHFWKLPFKFFLDKIPFEKCDLLIADTSSHKTYFVNKFNIPEKKIHVLPIGADTHYFNQAEAPANQVFEVGFYGHYVPLQGTKTIVETANVLKEHKDIHFELIGNGYRFKEAVSLAKKLMLHNITFTPTAEYAQLNARIAKFDICLGIFGESAKAGYVVPNKIYHYAAVGKCVVTRASEGINEIFTPDLDIICSSTKPENIAEKILMLKRDPDKRKFIGANAHTLITTKFNEVEIAKRFLSILAQYSSS